MKITVSGQKVFLDRHQALIRALSAHASVDTMPCGAISTIPAMDMMARAVMNRGVKKLSFRMSERFWKSAWAFDRRSRVAETLRQQRPEQPDLYLHLMGLFCPVWQDLAVPYAIYTDYTMQLARQRWLDWIPFNTEQEYQRWIALERRIYQNATAVFTMIQMAAASIIDDYGVPAGRVRMVGAGGRRDTPWNGRRDYGSKTLLFNGSRWLIKGGDRMMEAFPLVRQAIPDARLVMVGCSRDDVPEGVEVLGNVRDPRKMAHLFQTADLMVAPARIEALGTMCLEAMEYGTPCLVATGTGMLDYVRHDETGWVQADCSPVSLAEAIVARLRDPVNLRRCGEAGRRLIAARYNWGGVADSMLSQLGHHPQSTPGDVGARGIDAKPARARSAALELLHASLVSAG